MTETYDLAQTIADEKQRIEADARAQFAEYDAADKAALACVKDGWRPKLRTERCAGGIWLYDESRLDLGRLEICLNYVVRVDVKDCGRPPSLKSRSTTLASELWRPEHRPHGNGGIAFFNDELRQYDFVALLAETDWPATVEISMTTGAAYKVICGHRELPVVLEAIRFAHKHHRLPWEAPTP